MRCFGRGRVILVGRLRAVPQPAARAHHIAEYHYEYTKEESTRIAISTSRITDRVADSTVVG